MLLPTGSKTKEETPAVTQPTQEAEDLEDRLSRVLSQLEGAGKVQVLLTLACGEKTIYQTDTDAADRSSTVILTDSSRNQAGLVRQIDPPTYLGAVVLCQGADNSNIKLAITEAVANATGLGYHKITVLKMK